MSNDRNHHLVRRLDKKLDKVYLDPMFSDECCIFRVHDLLRKVNEDAYEPEVIAIGPYHHAKGYKPKSSNDDLQPIEEEEADQVPCYLQLPLKLQLMEKLKLRYLKRFLDRRGETSVERYIGAMQKLEERARNFYGESIGLDSDEFVEMMLLDSCFIVEILRKYILEELRDEDDPVFKFSHLETSLRRDLMLFENQLPFFVLAQFFNLTETSNCPKNKIISMAVDFLENSVLQGQQFLECASTIREEEVKHLLGLVHYCYCNSFRSILSERNTRNIDPSPPPSSLETTPNDGIIININPSSSEATLNGGIIKEGIKYLLDGFNRLLCLVLCYPFQLMFPQRKVKEGKSAIELKEAGINFEECTENTLFEISFKNGILKIPRLTFEDTTESLLRNLIAYEQYLPDSSWHLFTNYRRFIDRLINSSKDVEILRQVGIIENHLGDDEAVSSIVNKLGDKITVDDSFVGPYYCQVTDNVHQHCSKRFNVWMAKLRRDYFNTPWALISFFAAVVLLLLTLTQTIFAIISVV